MQVCVCGCGVVGQWACVCVCVCGREWDGCVVSAIVVVVCDNELSLPLSLSLTDSLTDSSHSFTFTHFHTLHTFTFSPIHPPTTRLDQDDSLPHLSLTLTRACRSVPVLSLPHTRAHTHTHLSLTHPPTHTRLGCCCRLVAPSPQQGGRSVTI